MGRKVYEVRWAANENSAKISACLSPARWVERVRRCGAMRRARRGEKHEGGMCCSDCDLERRARRCWRSADFEIYTQGIQKVGHFTGVQGSATAIPLAHCAEELRTPVFRRLTAAVVLGPVLSNIRHAATHSARAPVPPGRQGHGAARGVEGAAPRLARSQRRHDGRHPALRNTPNCACMCVQLWADWGEKAALCARACMLSVATHCSTPKLRVQVMSHGHTCKANPAAAAEVRPCVHTVAQCSVCPHRTIH